MKKFLMSCSLLIALIPTTSFAKARTLQEGGDRPSALSLELLGRAGAFSANFDYMVSDNVAAGGGLSFASGLGTSIIIVPIYLNYYMGAGNFRPYLTGGFDIVSGTGSSYSYLSSAIVAVLGGGVEYRGESGFLFRAAPYIFLGSSTALWAGVSFGFAF